MTSLINLEVTWIVWEQLWSSLRHFILIFTFIILSWLSEDRKLLLIMKYRILLEGLIIVLMCLIDHRKLCLAHVLVENLIDLRVNLNRLLPLGLYKFLQGLKLLILLIIKGTQLLTRIITLNNLHTTLFLRIVFILKTVALLLILLW